MSRSWSSVELGEVLDFFNGKSIKAKTSGAFRVYGSNGVIGLTDNYRYENAIIIGRVGAYCGSIEYERKKFWASDNTIVVKPKEPGTELFYYYLLITLKLNFFAGGAAQPLLTQTTLRRVSTKIPTLNIKHKIGSILSAYDDLTENSKRRIKILEEMAQTIYNEWFIKFRFPGHSKVKMVKSELGEIPEKWEVKTVGEVANIYRGRSYRSEELEEQGGMPFLNLKNIERYGGFREYGLKNYNGEYKETQTAVAGDIVIAVTDMTQERMIVARAARVPNIGFHKFVYSMDLVKVLPNDAIEGEFLYGVFKYSQFPDVVKERANGVNVLHLSPDRIAEYKLVLPPKGIRERYAEIIRSIYSLTDNLKMRNTNLQQTRDLLLPRLISGELDVENLDIKVNN
jgi:type I restriction enzyme S subunit